MSECVMCRRTDADLGHGAIFLTRPRPLMRSSTYKLCLECARKVRQEEGERAQEAIREAERSGV
jgi:hypothetical protein